MSDSMANFPCLNCGRVSVLAMQTTNTTGGDGYTVPILCLAACRQCGQWLKYEDEPPRRVHPWDVPTLTPWCAFYLGHFMTELVAREEMETIIQMTTLQALDTAFCRTRGTA